MKRLLFPLAIIAVCFAAAPAGAQTLGTFRWNIAPFCNVLNLTVTQQGDSFALTGYEEASCDASLPRWPVNGTAIIQADGTIRLAATTIFANGTAIHTSATLDATTRRSTAPGPTIRPTTARSSSTRPRRPASRACRRPTRRRTNRARHPPRARRFR